MTAVDRGEVAALGLLGLARALGGEVSSGGILAPGPGHKPHDRSLSVKLDRAAPDGFVVHSFAGNDPIACRDYVRERAGLPKWQPAPKRNGAGSAETVAKVAGGARVSFVYRTAEGEPHLRVTRYPKRGGGKGFAQQHWTGSAWADGSKDIEHVPYRLPELLASNGPVFIVEGEKCADRLAQIGHTATTAPGGAGKWRPYFARWFKGRDVIVLPDNDRPGEQHADDIVRNLNGWANSIRRIDLPGLPQAGDVVDYLEADAKREPGFLDWCLAAAAVRAEGAAPAGETNQREPHVLFLPSSLAGKPVPEREWQVRDWIPMKTTTSLYGDGGTGKTLLVQQLLTAAAVGGYWLGREVERGPALGYFCEDDLDELHRRQHAINAEMGLDWADIGAMAWICAAGRDTFLMTFEGTSPVGRLTDAWHDLRQGAIDIGARIIAIDTAADVFGGNENDRAQVRAFIQGALNRLARETEAAVVLLAHPSRSGMGQGGSGDGGSTAWSNSVRSRLSLERPPKAEGVETSTDLRVLSRKKANYAAAGDEIEIRYQRGLFVPVMAQQPDAVDGIIERNRPDEALTAIRKLLAQGHDLSPVSNSPNFAPTVIVRHRLMRGTRKQIETAVADLMNEGRISVVHRGPRSRARACIEVRPSSRMGETEGDE